MKKSFLIIFVLMGLSLFISSEIFAADASLQASAIIPGPSFIDPVVLSVIPNAVNPKIWDSFTDVTATGKLEFTSSLPGGVLRLKSFVDPLDATKIYNIFLPDNYFSIDVGYIWEGTPFVKKINVTFTDGTPLNLGTRATATLIAKSRLVDGSEKTEAKTDAIGNGKYRLTGLTQQVDLSSQLDKKWLRLYVGIASMDPAADFLDSAVTPTAPTPFVPGDAPGTYTGTLVITAGYI